jgi:hypothetical protein
MAWKPSKPKLNELIEVETYRDMTPFMGRTSMSISLLQNLIPVFTIISALFASCPIDRLLL